MAPHMWASVVDEVQGHSAVCMGPQMGIEPLLCSHKQCDCIQSDEVVADPAVSLQWHNAVVSNVNAYNSDVADGAACMSPYEPEHNTDMLIYAANMAGEVGSPSLLHACLHPATMTAAEDSVSAQPVPACDPKSCAVPRVWLCLSLGIQSGSPRAVDINGI